MCLLPGDLAEGTDAHVADDDLDPLADHLFQVLLSVLRYQYGALTDHLFKV